MNDEATLLYTVQSEIKKDYIRLKTILANIIPFCQTFWLYTVSQAINMVCRESKVLHYANWEILCNQLNHSFLKKASLDVMQSHPQHRTCFG